MTKKELIDAIESMPDDARILIEIRPSNKPYGESVNAFSPFCNRDANVITILATPTKREKVNRHA